jgi:hypothetical protein
MLKRLDKGETLHSNACQAATPAQALERGRSLLLYFNFEPACDLLSRERIFVRSEENLCEMSRARGCM